MRFSQKTWIVLCAFVLAFMFVPASHAQVNSNLATVNLNAILAESITVVAGPATVNFTLAPNGPANGSAPVTINTSWALKKTRTSVNLYAYFASANALNDLPATDVIPNTSVSGKINGAAGATVFNTGTPYGGNFGMTVFTQAITAANANSSRPAAGDTIALIIDTTGLALPAATYTGVLNIQAQAL
jgi:hypothetical protein